MSALYVYAVVPDEGALKLGPGIAGHEVQTVAAGGVRAVVHALDSPTPYAGDDAQVQRWVQEHFAVVEQAWSGSGSALPMTFDVLVASEDETDASTRLSRWLVSNAETLRTQLEHLKNRCELKVEVRLRLGSVTGPALDALDAALAKASRGMRVLLEKKREQLQRTVAREVADGLHAELREALCSLAVDVSTLKITKLGSDEVGVLSLALLVDNTRVEEIGRVLAAFQTRVHGLSIAFLGPWPPFHFAELPTVGA